TGAQLAKEEMERRNAASAETTAAARTKIAETGASKEAREAGQQQFQNTISDLGANAPKTAQEYQQRIDALPHGVATRILAAVPVDKFDPTTFTKQVRQLGMTPEQQTQAAQAEANAAQTKAHQDEVAPHT